MATAYQAPPDAVRLPMPERESHEDESVAALLVSYVYSERWKKFRTFKEDGVTPLGYRNWMLDSGAYTAWTKGKVIDLEEYTQYAYEHLQNDPSLVEVMGLDVIGDWEASLRNVEYMHKHGVPAIPTFHVGSPREALDECARYDKFCLGGAVGYHDKQRWAEQCFARVWPAKIHGLGWGSEDLLMGLPWHSADSSNWALCSTVFGNWKSMPGGSLRGCLDLAGEVAYYLNLEQRVKQRWRRVHRQQGPEYGFTLRLADIGSGHTTPWAPHLKPRYKTTEQHFEQLKERQKKKAAASKKSPKKTTKKTKKPRRK